ncbi:Holliday junction branch migration protein RuvA [Dubosiella newyorkensis]|jgi:Holliday junction DNA helicase RuvA|uniref:Holliday junction branch migration protein RuvA n=1 Tax=Dubosiella newyorkensis TaxID=1862672 RepID=UPI002355EE06|nr:Holliday junction branch migration protein RuvA [Dubosiella newyorkensis]MCI9041223.1 Holliday junction branch migration protein RuvA [Dubosiella newyorkensis]
MIAFLDGIVKLIRKNSIVLDVHGVGYEVYVATPHTFVKEDAIFLYTYHQIREESQLLFGFKNELDLQIFERLLNVKGIGPKTIMNMMSKKTGDEIVQAIETQDVKLLKSLPGIGPKSASQIVLDLKGQLVAYRTQVQEDKHPIWQQTEEALIALGYKSAQLSSIKREMIKHNDWSVDEMLRRSLMMIAQEKGI